MDNALSHPYIDVLQSSDKKISAMYLPANKTSLNQPMDQGVLVTLKRHLQKSSAEKLLFLDEEGHSMVSFIKTIIASKFLQPPGSKLVLKVMVKIA